MIQPARLAWELCRDTFSCWLGDKGARLGAALAFYSLFAIGPLLVIVVAVASALSGGADTSAALDRQLASLVGMETATTIESFLNGIQRQGSGTFAALASLATMLVAASAVVIQLKDALNTIWQVKPKPGRSLKIFFQDYIVSLASLFALGLVLITSLAVAQGLDGIGTFLDTSLPIMRVAFKTLNDGVSFALVTLLFAAIYKLLPDVRLHWRDVLPGAVVTSMLFFLGRFAFSVYLKQQNLASIYGATASLLGISLWVYYFSQIIFLGAEFTKVYAMRFKGRVDPRSGVDWVSATVGKREPF